MPRHKQSVPNRLSDDEAETQRWHLGQGQSSSNPDPHNLIEEKGAKNRKTDGKIKKSLPLTDSNRKKKRIENDEEFKNLLDCSDFIVPVNIRNKKSDQDRFIEEIALLDFSTNEGKKLPLEKVPDEENFWIYVSNVPKMSFAFFQWFYKNANETDKMYLDRKKKGDDPDEYECIMLSEIPEIFLLEAFQMNTGAKKSCMALSLARDNVSISSGKFQISVIVSDATIFKLNHPSDVVPNVSALVKKALRYFFKKEYENEESSSFDTEEKPDVDELYDKIKKYHQSHGSDLSVINPQHQSLIPSLRPYQKMAVKWMLSKEKDGKMGSNKDFEKENRILHPLYEEVRSLSGTPLYYHKLGGFIVKEKPFALPSCPGGILADEMGLGKTVEVLSLILCNQRSDVPKPKYKEPLKVQKEKKRKLTRKRRSPSPVEFFLNATERSEADVIPQVDGRTELEDSDESSDEEYIPVPSRSRGGRTLQDDESNSSTPDDSESDLDDEPPKRKRVRFVDTVPKKTENLEDKQGQRGGVKSVLKKTNAGERFDPKRILHGKTVNQKSPMSDMVLSAVVNLSKPEGVSTYAIKKYVAEKYKKTSTQHLNNLKKALQNLTSSGHLINTSHQKGASGSFIVNPDFENFDTRGLYANLDLDPVGRTIEEVITKHCYDGKPYDHEENKEKISAYQKKKKEPSTFQRLKSMYETSLAEMSEACEASLEYRKVRAKMNRTFFDTKVEQQEYFECICGSELPSSMDNKHRIQCTKCPLWQHSECVKYNVEDPYRGDYICPHCWTSEEPVESGATLIVSPNAISHQWIEEIQKHIKHKNVKMLFYKGTKQSGYIQPRDLARYDIVITSYTILQSETNYVDLPHSNSAEGRRFRNPKRFMAIPAPLPCVKWWRVCLDEAQMIECTTTKTAEMALRLSAINRWCVTGTPVEKSLDDLQGLLVFLKVDPYYIAHWWKECLYKPYCKGMKNPLLEVLYEFLWRTCKKDVLHQINIPSQTEEFHWLSFSPIEEHFYRRLHIDSSKEAIAKIKRVSQDLDKRLTSFDRNTMNGLLAPLVRLRQSCCHPQAVRGQFLNMQKSTAMTMDELLDQMIRKVRLECEDQQRIVIASLNGLAALDIIEEKWVEAVEKYREILRLADENKDILKTDTLQKLHTVTNLAEVLEAKHENIIPTLRDSGLREEAIEMKKKYLTKYQSALNASKEAVTPITKQVEELKSTFLCETEAWYVYVSDKVFNLPHLEDSMLKLVWEEMAQFYDIVNAKELKQIEKKYSSSREVMYKVGQRVTEMDGMRDRVCSEVESLESRPPETFLSDAVECHLRLSGASKKNKKLCKLCQVHSDIEIYEGLIFHFIKDDALALRKDKKSRATITSDEYKELEEKGVYLLDEQRKGTWGDSETERLLRALLKFARNHQSEFSHSILDDGSTHLKMIETMKKEFKLIRIHWRQIFDQVAGVDELNMSVMRLRLRFEDEPETNPSALKPTKKGQSSSLATREKDRFETIYILEQHELPSQKLKLSSEKIVAQNELRKKFGQLQYLENLKKSDFARHGGGENPDTCPICTQTLGRQWSVLQCGHCYCVQCVQVLMREYSSIVTAQRSLKCPICRNSTFHAEISFVTTEVSNERENVDATKKAYEAVKGSWSTKIRAVVQTLIQIQDDYPSAKSLVFSTWPDVLDILSSALTENNIQFTALHTQSKFKRNLEKFKNREDVKVLLLPVASGAHGLNLIEASHVLLVEPILNPAQELQAIGRVHRIGQTKPTVVHRFIINATIEERMHKILSTFHEDERQQGSHSTEENLLTLRDLKNIFVDKED